MSKRDFASAFQFEGRFVGFVLKDGYKLKYLRLSTATGEYTIKLSKEVRRSLPLGLALGDWLRVSGWQKQEDGVAKFKAEAVWQASPNALPPAAAADPQPVSKPKPAACILVCQKSDCCKLGGRAVSAALETELRDRNLTAAVQVKGTGCMKRCKAGPNLVMPDKTRYTRISAADVPAILDKHFPTESAAIEPRCLEPVGVV